VIELSVAIHHYVTYPNILMTGPQDLHATIMNQAV